MEIQVMLVLMEFPGMALQALPVNQDPKARRVPKEMSSLTNQVLLAHPAALGLWGGRDFLAFLEPLGFQVSVIY